MLAPCAGIGVSGVACGVSSDFADIASDVAVQPGNGGLSLVADVANAAKRRHRGLGRPAGSAARRDRAPGRRSMRQTALNDLLFNEGVGMSGRLRRLWWVAALVAAVGVGLGLWLSLSGSSGSAQTLPPPRARVYTSFDACLLTDSAGIAGSQAAPVWAGMQAASLKTARKVSYLAVSGPDTEANAIAFVNTLVQRKCDLVLAVGDSQVAAAKAQAKVFPAQRFVVVGPAASGPVEPDGANLAVVPGGRAQQVQAAVAQAVENAPGQ